jgi:hypothetical protein
MMDEKMSNLDILSNENESKCVICQCDIEKDDFIKITLCYHFFHTECLEFWFTKHENCPMCRKVLN